MAEKKVPEDRQSIEREHLLAELSPCETECFEQNGTTERECGEVKLVTEKQHAGVKRGANSKTDSCEICVVVAGKPGNGKSTALNNIFGLNLPTATSSLSVTSQIIKTTKRRNGVSLHIIDTPGLGARDIDRKRIASQMADSIKGLDYTLLYCLSVAPSCRLNELDNTIIAELHSTLGKQVWDKCVLLLTFSDTARRESFISQEKEKEYRAYLNHYAQDFYHVLRESGADVARVKTIFEYKNKQERDQQKTIREIVAIPVGKKTNKIGEPDILPGILSDHKDWTDVVFHELMKKKTDKRRRQPYILFKYGAAVFTSTIAGGLVGAAVGAGVGAIAGIPGGPLGVVAGGAVGGAIGGGLATSVSLPASTIVAVNMWGNKYSTKKTNK